MGRATIYHGTDAWVNSLKPATEYGGGQYLRMLTPGAGTEYGFIRCNNPVPRDAKVLSVKLYLYGVGDWGGVSTRTVSVQRVAAKWTDDQINYNNRPGVTGSAVSLTQANPADGTVWIFDLTSVWQTIVNGASNYGFRISTTSTTERKFYSFDAADFKPVWEFLWSDAPFAPTELSPAGNAAVTLQRPVLTMNFHDVSGSMEMGGLRVQFKSTNTGWTNNALTGGFASPDWDSGTQVTSDPELNTATAVSAISSTIWPGLSVGGNVWWTTQVEDAAGNWSKWSDPVKFQRVAKGTLVLDSPTGGSISDPTMLVIWHLTGATITGWQVTVADDANPTELLKDTGRRQGNNTSWGIPKGVITDETVNIRLTVRTWSDNTRTATPGDKIHEEVVATFTFNSSGTVDSVHDLTVSPRPNRQPGLWVRWHRPNAPDHYEIRRGPTGQMKVLDTDLDPAALLDPANGADAYAYLDKSVSPFKFHNYRVVCKTSSGVSYGPTQAGYLDLETAWIEDLDYDHLVPILYREGASDSVTVDGAPQIALVAQPSNAKKVVRITQGQVGLEGSVAGVLTDYGGLTAETARKHLEWMQARPERSFRLSTGGVNLRVIIGDVVIAPWRSREDANGEARQVSFNFWEQ